MHKNWREQSIGEIVATFPLSSEVFRSAGIDFCCGGGRLLGDVIEEQGIVETNLYRALDNLAEHSESEEAAAFPEMSPEELVEHILIRHHAYLWETLPDIHARLITVLRAHGERHPELYDVYKLLSELTKEMEPHLIREESELFPSVLNQEANATQQRQTLVRILEEEHESTREVLHQLRHATNDYSLPSDGCDNFAELYKQLEALEKDTEEHYHLEDDLLFKKITAPE